MVADFINEEFDVETAELITQLRGTGMTWTRIAHRLNVNRRALFRMRGGMLPEVTLNDDELFDEILSIKTDNPHFGEMYVKAALLSRGFKVQRRRIRDCLREIDADGIVQRRRPRITRGVYSVPGANFLWHLDGNEKLQMFHIYLHGCVDGHSRKVIYMKCAGNKKAPTTLKIFHDAALTYGLPRFIRIDKGGENCHIAEFMERNSQLLDRERSVLVGPSVRNVRIERLWKEINDITRPFKTFFISMEIEGILNADDPIQLFALYYINLPRIQKALDNFVEIWDVHGIRTANFQSPRALFLTEQHGSYVPVMHHPLYEPDPYEGVTAEQNEFAHSIVPDPSADDGNNGVNLYTDLVLAIQALPV